MLVVTQMIRYFDRSRSLRNQIQDHLYTANHMYDSLGRIIEETQSFDGLFLAASLFALLVSSIALYMILVLTIKKDFPASSQTKTNKAVQCFHRKLMLPIFMVLVFLSYIFTVTFIIGRLSNCQRYLIYSCINKCSPSLFFQYIYIYI
jgi:hypothetical protein